MTELTETENKKLYTTKEIEEDIWNLEGVKIKIGNVDWLFKAKYSDFYNNEKMDDEETVDDLKDKVSNYFAHCVHARMQ